MLDEPPATALDALRRPMPPLAFALQLMGVASAAMDLSDGLAMDLRRLCRASGCGAEIRADSLPGAAALADLPPAVRLKCQLSGGEDYQLLFAADPREDAALQELAASHGIELTRVGVLTAGQSVDLKGANWPGGSFAHFAEAS